MANLSIEPNDRITFKVLHEDDDLLVVGKPSHLVTLPGLGHERDSLLNGLFAAYGPRLQNLGRDRDFGLLHRLDRDTSGLVLVALRSRAYDRLREMFAERGVAKYYWAVVRDVPNRPSGVIRRPIAEFEGKTPHDTRVKKLARISSAGKPAITAYRVIHASHTGALLECRAVTGRLHQIRVHLESIGSPILADELYGPSSVLHAAPRLALHAHRLAFAHPTTGTRLDLRTAWPQDLRGVLRRLGLARPDVDEHGVPRRGPVAKTAPEALDAELDGVEGGHELEGDAVGEEESGVGEPPA